VASRMQTRFSLSLSVPLSLSLLGQGKSFSRMRFIQRRVDQRLMAPVAM